MTLRQKLLTVFGALSLLILLTSGVTLWTIAQWKTTGNDLETHYQRSLQLTSVRAATFRAVKEVPDALNGDDDARSEFNPAIERALNDFKQWSKLALTETEKQQVQHIRSAFEKLTSESRYIFDLVDAGRIEEAMVLMEDQLEEETFATFEKETELAIASDEGYRQIVLAGIESTRHTAQTVLAVASFGAVSLVLLLAAYLTSDLFRPLREVESALDSAAHGDFDVQLSEERNDEIGDISAAYNRLVKGLSWRRRSSRDDNPVKSKVRRAWMRTPSSATLHSLVSQLRCHTARLTDTSSKRSDHRSATDESDRRSILDDIEKLSYAISRVTEFSFPLDIKLANTDVRALLYDTISQSQEEFVRRTISFELNIAPDIGYAIIDRLKLREAIGELIRNAIKALPDHGGHIGLRARLIDDATNSLIEVADDGKGTDTSPIDALFKDVEAQQDPKSASSGLRFTKGIVEEHGGRLNFMSQPGEGTYVQIMLPFRYAA